MMEGNLIEFFFRGAVSHQTGIKKKCFRLIEMAQLIRKSGKAGAR